MTNYAELWRIKECMKAAGYPSKTSIYTRIKAGTWTKPIAVSAKTVGWPAGEVLALCSARIAGADDQVLQALVAKLHTKRGELMPSI
jgi:prophage regulatory protein